MSTGLLSPFPFLVASLAGGQVWGSVALQALAPAARPPTSDAGSLLSSPPMETPSFSPQNTNESIDLGALCHGLLGAAETPQTAQRAPPTATSAPCQEAEADAHCCWGGLLKDDRSECEAGFVTGKAHFKNKFCSRCRHSLAVPASRVRALTPEIQSYYQNHLRAGVRTRAIGHALSARKLYTHSSDSTRPSSLSAVLEARLPVDRRRRGSHCQQHYHMRRAVARGLPQGVHRADAAVGAHAKGVDQR